MKHLYIEVIEAIVSDKRSTFGAIAVARIAKVPGLQLDDGGKVESLTGDPLTVLVDVLACYEKLAGKMSVIMCRKVVDPIRARAPTLVLPPALS